MALPRRRLSRYAYLFYLAVPCASAAWEGARQNSAVRVSRAATAAHSPLAPSPRGRARPSHVHPPDGAISQLSVQPAHQLAREQAKLGRPRRRVRSDHELTVSQLLWRGVRGQVRADDLRPPAEQRRGLHGELPAGLGDQPADRGVEWCRVLTALPPRRLGTCARLRAAFSCRKSFLSSRHRASTPGLGVCPNPGEGARRRRGAVLTSTGVTSTGVTSTGVVGRGGGRVSRQRGPPRSPRRSGRRPGARARRRGRPR
jgi:hypothetical protein